MADSKLNAREKAALEEKKKDQKIRNRFIVVGIIVAVLAALVIVVNSRLFTNTFPALKVTDGTTTTNYALADVNYEYQSSYMQIAQTYSSYGLIDTSTPLNQQQCIFLSDGGTWDDYFKDQADSNLVEKTAVWKAAQAAGYTTLTEDEQAQIDELFESFALYANYYGYSVDGYLALNYGSGNSEKTVREKMAQELLMSRFLEEQLESYTYTDQDLDSYYAEHENELNKVNYIYTLISGAADEAAGLDSEAAMAVARTNAQTIVSKAESEEAFRAAVLDVTGSEATKTSYSVNSFLNMYGDDMTAEDLAAGKCFTHETSSGVYAIYILGIDDNDYNTVSMRHILIEVADEDGDGTLSDAEKQSAYDAVKAIEEEWLAGEATEESFAALANEKSEDTGTNTTGGLYEDVTKGQMVPEIDAFLFEGHKSGDTAIVYGESSNYSGYHLVYFVGEGGNHRDSLAEDALRSEDYNDFYQSLLAPYTSERTFMWRYVMKA